MYLCVCAHVSVRIVCICIYVCAHVSVRIVCICIYVCAHVSVHIVCICIYVCVHMLVCVYTVGVMKKLPLPFSVHRLNGVQRSPFMETTFISSQPAGWPAGQPFSEQTAISNLHRAG